MRILDAIGAVLVGVVVSVFILAVILAALALSIKLMALYTFNPNLFWYFFLTVPVFSYFAYRKIKENLK